MGTTDFPKILSPFSAQVLALREQLSAFERLDPAAQAAAGDVQLKNLVRHARCHSGYWQKRLSAYGSRARFDSLPVLSRADLQQHAHDIDVVRALDVEDEMRIPGQRPHTQPRQVEFVRIPWRSRGGIATDVAVGPLQRVDEAQGCVRCALT